MGWKQTLILGGAVLLLAACDRATAPIVNARDGGAAVNSTAAPTSPSTDINLLVEPINICNDASISINSGEIIIVPGDCGPVDW